MAHRTVVSELVEALSLVCTPFNDQIFPIVHPLILPIVRLRNLALMRELSWVCGFPDYCFLVDYIFGMSTAGWGDPAPRFTLRTTEPVFPIDQAWCDIHTHNAFIMSRVCPSADPELDAASWKKTEAEFADGSLAVSYTHLTLPTILRV